MPAGEVLELSSLNNIWILYIVQRITIDRNIILWFVGNKLWVLHYKHKKNIVCTVFINQENWYQVEICIFILISRSDQFWDGFFFIKRKKNPSLYCICIIFVQYFCLFFEKQLIAQFGLEKSNFIWFLRSFKLHRI